MGTVLNQCKEVRKEIREIEAKIDEAVFMWIQHDGKMSVAGFFRNKAEEIRGSVFELKGKLEQIDIILEKDSEVRSYYNKVYEKCCDFLQKTQ